MRTLAAVMSLVAAGAAHAGEPAAKAREPARAVAEVVDAQGRKLGTVSFTEAPRGLLVEVDLRVLPAGTLAFHVHEVGRCEPPFKTAGGHFNPGKRQHGLMNRGGQHAGDLPNLEVAEDGRARLQLFAPGLTLSGPVSMLDADGAAVVIHAGPDDHRSDPAGNAGDRIACGVVVKK